MGEEIKYTRFNKSDYSGFKKRLDIETELLAEWFNKRAFSTQAPIAGYELEAWLLDKAANPCPHNEAFLEQANNALITPELAKFNIELNVVPQQLSGDVLQNFHTSLTQLWNHCQQSAEKLDCNILSVGILPTLRDEHLTLDNISTMERYRALNEQVLRQRNGKSIRLNIVGEENLVSEHMDVMLEAAATSLQIHIQVPQDLAVRYYNASVAISAPMVAVCANSPFMFGKFLWSETRIPVFEQSVPTGGFEGAAYGPIKRVSFGTGYARDSLLECFIENKEHFPIILPVQYDSEPDQLRSLRLHNGTIWRWNRPLIGHDDDGTPHIRIEHRVVSSGPSNVDNIANIAFYYGLAHYYATIADPIEDKLDFSIARDNFYRAAQHGVKRQIEWVDGTRTSISRLVLDRLLVEAEAGLSKLDINDNDIRFYLGIIHDRINTGQTGSEWQKQFFDKHNGDVQKLTHSYFHNQQLNTPVHTWDFIESQ